jgi:hypothetical protein
MEKLIILMGALSQKIPMLRRYMGSLCLLEPPLMLKFNTIRLEIVSQRGECVGISKWALLALKIKNHIK